MPGRALLLGFCCLGWWTCGGFFPMPPKWAGPTPNPTAPPKVTDPAPLVWLPARVRRLSNRELDNSVAELLFTATKVPFSSQLAPDMRQSGFTLNADQRVDGTLGDQLWTTGEALAEQAVAERLGSLVTCN